MENDGLYTAGLEQRTNSRCGLHSPLSLVSSPHTSILCALLHMILYSSVSFQRQQLVYGDALMGTPPHRTI